MQDFDVQHDYLLSSSPSTQTRIRKRGQKGAWVGQNDAWAVGSGGGAE